MGTILSCKKVITLTNSLDTQIVIYQIIRTMMTDQIYKKEQLNINFEKKKIQGGFKRTQIQKIFSKEFLNYQILLRRSNVDIQIMQNQSYYLILTKIVRQNQQELFYSQLLLNKKENKSYCVWQSNDSDFPALIPTHLKDHWRFLYRQAKDFNQNYPDGWFCPECQEEKGCKQDCKNQKQLTGLTLSYVQKILQVKNKNKKIMLNISLESTENIRKSQLKYSFRDIDLRRSIVKSKQMPLNDAQIQKLISKPTPEEQQQIEMNLRKSFVKNNYKYAFKINKNHPHVQLGAFTFEQNYITKNKKCVPGQIGGVLVATQSFPQQGWHQIKLKANSASSRISLGLVNESSKVLMNFTSGEFFQYNGNVQGKEAIIFKQGAVFGQQKILRGIMTLILRVNIQQGLVSFINKNDKQSDQEEIKIIKIPGNVLGDNRKVYPYVRISQEQDGIMFI